MVSRASERPAYLQIADALREQMRGGTYPPGAKLPSESELRERWGVASKTVRAALDQLRAEGLVVGRQGVGSFVREQVVPRRLSTDMSTKGEPPAMLATSYFPQWVIDKAPNLADPNVSGLPRWLREAFGETYSTDVLTVRMPTPAEQQKLDLPRGVPVQVIQGGEFDGEHRPLHYIEVIAAGGRIEFAYVYGKVPS